MDVVFDNEQQLQTSTEVVENPYLKKVSVDQAEIVMIDGEKLKNSEGLMRQELISHDTGEVRESMLQPDNLQLERQGSSLVEESDREECDEEETKKAQVKQEKQKEPLKVLEQ